MLNTNAIKSELNAINLQPEIMHDITQPILVTDMVDANGRVYVLYFHPSTLVGCSYEEIIELCADIGLELPTIKELMAIHADHSQLIAFADSHKGMILSCEKTHNGYGRKCLSFIDGSIGIYSIDFGGLNAIGVTRKYMPAQA